MPAVPRFDMNQTANPLAMQPKALVALIVSGNSLNHFVMEPVPVNSVASQSCPT